MNIHTMTLTKQLSPDDTEKVCSVLFDPKICTPGLTYRNKESSDLISDVFADHGIKLRIVQIRDENGYCHDVMYLKVNLYNVISKEKSMVRTFRISKKNIEKLEKKFAKYFSIFPEGLNSSHDYYITRLDLCCDIRLEDDKRRIYLKLANGCLLPMKAEKTLWYDSTGKKNRPSNHRVEVSFPSYNVVIYDKQTQLNNCNINGYDSDDANGILRFELALKNQGIRNLNKKLFDRYRVTEISPITLIYAIHRSGLGEQLFLENFKKLFFDGNYYPLKVIRPLVFGAPMKDKTKVKILELLDLIAMHRSIDKAVGEYVSKYSDSDIPGDDIKQRRKDVESLKKLETFGVNPFPLPARYQGDYLLSIPNLLKATLGGKIL